MELSPREVGSITVLSPRGRIDHAHSTSFKQALDKHLVACTRDGCAILIDMSGVDYISSVGLRALMIAAHAVKAQGGRFALAALAPMVREVFEISGFDRIFTLYDTTDAGLQALGHAA